MQIKPQAPLFLPCPTNICVFRSVSLRGHLICSEKESPKPQKSIF